MLLVLVTVVGTVCVRAGARLTLGGAATRVSFSRNVTQHAKGEKGVAPQYK